MDIRDIDKNFAQNNLIDAENSEFYKVTEEPFSLHGVFYDDKKACFLRMPQTVADSVNEGVSYLNQHTAGGRVRFSTNSKSISLVVKYGSLDKMNHMALIGLAGFSLCENTKKGESFVASVGPEWNQEKGYVAKIELSGKGMHSYTLYFPLYNGIKELYIGLDKKAKIDKGMDYEIGAPILYYGSSITQGGCASRPDTCYQSLIAKMNNVDYVNLGFSGSAKAENEMIDYLSTLPCSILVLDYDHNAPTPEYLEETHYKAYERYRKIRPLTPILLISRPNDCDSADGIKRAKIIQNTYKKALANKDKNIYFIKGESLFKQNADISTVDGCHPTDLGFYFMAQRIEKEIRHIRRRKK